MIDYIFCTADQNTMISQLGNYWIAGGSDGCGGTINAQWRSDVAFPVVINDETDPLNIVAVPGYYLWVAIPALDTTLAAIPSCIIVADRNAFTSGSNNYMLQTTLTQPQLLNYLVSPTLAGTNYPFGQP